MEMIAGSWRIHPRRGTRAICQSSHVPGDAVQRMRCSHAQKSQRQRVRAKHSSMKLPDHLQGSDMVSNLRSSIRLSLVGSLCGPALYLLDCCVHVLLPCLAENWPLLAWPCFRSRLLEGDSLQSHDSALRAASALGSLRFCGPPPSSYEELGEHRCARHWVQGEQGQPQGNLNAKAILQPQAEAAVARAETRNS
jgi:hypothetical protein